jgi:hypothetical protein
MPKWYGFWHLTKLSGEWFPEERDREGPFPRRSMRDGTKGSSEDGGFGA